MSTSPGRSAGDNVQAGARRRARERALGLCYEAELKSRSTDEVLAELIVAPDSYAETLFRGVTTHAGEIEQLIREHATSWTLDRMPAVDRQLLRIGAYELINEPLVPVAVIIDEAVELAKQFSTADSGRFVNGVLAAIARQIRPDEARPHE